MQRWWWNFWQQKNTMVLTSLKWVNRWEYMINLYTNSSVFCRQFLKVFSNTVYQVCCLCSEQALERQIALRDSVSSGTTLAVQSLDQKNMAGIGDLRGRVARYAHKSWVKHCLQTLRYNRRWLQQRHACQRNIWRATPAEVWLPASCLARMHARAHNSFHPHQTKFLGLMSTLVHYITSVEISPVELGCSA